MHAQLGYSSKFRHETYKVNKYNRVDQPLNVPGLAVIRPVNKLFANVVYHRSYRLIKKSTRYENDVADELSKITKETAVQMKDRNFPGNDSVSIIFFRRVSRHRVMPAIFTKVRSCGYSSTTYPLLLKQ